MRSTYSLAELEAKRVGDVALQDDDMLVVKELPAIVPADAELKAGEAGEFMITGDVPRAGVYTLAGTLV